MKNIGTGISRTILTLAVAGMGFTLTPRTASADIIFGVDETVVDGSASLGAAGQFDADKITGFYNETLTLEADGSFDVSALASFDTFNLGGPEVGSGAAGLAEGVAGGIGYDLKAVFTAEGQLNPDGSITFGSGFVSVFVDPSQDNVYTPAATGTSAWGVVDGSGDDAPVMSGSLVSGGGGLNPSLGGFFDLLFGSMDLTAFGDTYLPGLANINFLFGTVDGDFDTVPNPPAPGTYENIQGQLSVVFVPEPATMTLLGLGLLGSAMAARRRRKV